MLGCMKALIYIKQKGIAGIKFITGKKCAKMGCSALIIIAHFSITGIFPEQGLTNVLFFQRLYCDVI